MHVPHFKLVILDESESLFNHFSANTLNSPGFIMTKTKHILQDCDYVLTCDALWGAESFEMLEEFGLSQRLVINDYRGTARHYEFLHDWNRFIDYVIQVIGNGKNIYIASMSTEVLGRVRNIISERYPDCQAIIHTRMTDDTLKRQLADADELWITPLTGASPTVEAGVDHSRHHFHVMVGIACLQSTTASGFYQMLWRVRHLEESVVKIYAQPSICLGPGGHKRITVDECIKTLQYTKTKVMEFENVKTIKNLDGETILVPRLSPIALATAHNDARRLNSQSRFYKEFVDIAESQEHTVSYVVGEAETSSHRKKVNVSPSNMNMEILLTAAEITDSQFEYLHGRIVACEATEEDKQRHYKFRYMRSWRIDIIDEAFVKENGIAVSCPSLKRLIRYIYGDVCLRDWEDPEDDKLMVHCRVFREIIAALGLKHPLDFAKNVAATECRDKLMTTTYFSQYETMSRVFNPRAEAVTEWNNKRITEALNTVFHVFGLNIKSTAQRSRKTGRTYTYSIDESKATRIAALINLRMRFSVAVDDQDLMNCLKSIGYDKYAKYVKIADTDTDSVRFLEDKDEDLDE